MTQAQTEKASVTFARTVADEAIRHPGGVTLTFLSEKYGGFDIAGRAARRFQTCFSGMCASSRKRIQREIGQNIHVRDTWVKGPYDSLSTFRDPMPYERGWTVKVVPAMMIELDVEVTSNDTGERILRFDPIQRQFDAVMKLIMDEEATAVRDKRNMQDERMLTQEQEAIMLAVNPKFKDAAREFWNWYRDKAPEPKPTGLDSVTDLDVESLGDDAPPDTEL